MAVLIMVTMAGADTVAADWAWDLPSWMEPPPVPDDNPMSAAKVELGRRLFHDRRLSGPGFMSCATCHDPRHAFSDHRRTAIGITGRVHPRNSMALANVAYFTTLTWADPALVRLEDQAAVPLFGDHPVEMAVAGQEDLVLERLRGDALYTRLFAAAFPDSGGRIDFDGVVRAIAAFERTLISYDAPFDRFRFGGDPGALSRAAQRGMDLFLSDRLGCGACHAGRDLTDLRFHNTGLYNTDGGGGLPAGNTGLHEHTGLPSDMGRFRTPSLRNVALTAPYMHDGSTPSLSQVIDDYAAGGRAAREGNRSPLTAPELTGFVLSAGEKADLLAFLDSLTDWTFVENPAFARPYP